MKKTLILCVSATLLLSACATQEMRLTDPKTKKSVVCGGHRGKSIAFGMAGYKWQENEDRMCLKAYQNEGYVFQGIE